MANINQSDFASRSPAAARGADRVVFSDDIVSSKTWQNPGISPPPSESAPYLILFSDRNLHGIS